MTMEYFSLEILVFNTNNNISKIQKVTICNVLSFKCKCVKCGVCFETRDKLRNHTQAIHQSMASGNSPDRLDTSVSTGQSFRSISFGEPQIPTRLRHLDSVFDCVNTTRSIPTRLGHVESVFGRVNTACSSGDSEHRYEPQISQPPTISYQPPSISYQPMSSCGAILTDHAYQMGSVSSGIVNNGPATVSLQIPDIKETHPAFPPRMTPGDHILTSNGNIKTQQNKKTVSLEEAEIQSKLGHFANLLVRNTTTAQEGTCEPSGHADMSPVSAVKLEQEESLICGDSVDGAESTGAHSLIAESDCSSLDLAIVKTEPNHKTGEYNETTHPVTPTCVPDSRVLKNPVSVDIIASPPAGVADDNRADSSETQQTLSPRPERQIQIWANAEMTDSENVSFQCDTCYELFPTWHLIEVHLSRFHRGIGTSSKKVVPVVQGGKAKPERYNAYADATLSGSFTDLNFQGEYLLKLDTEKGLNSIADMNSLKCLQCDREFKNHTALKQHVRNHIARKPCIICGKTCGRISEMRRHMRTHSAPRPFRCQYCSLSFKARGQLLSHYSAHTEATEFPCDNCHERFVSTELLRKHYKWRCAVTSGKRIHRCKKCPACFETPYSLAEHKYTHKSEPRPYLCTVCGKSFQYNRDFYMHSKMHEDDKQLSCSTCGKSFTRGSSLRVHLRIHTGEKPYLCNECGKGFKTASERNRHSKIH